jgi:hypothetical protein
VKNFEYHEPNFPSRSEFFIKPISDIQEMRNLFTLFITEIRIDEVIIGDETVISVPAGFVGRIELCGSQNILIFKNLSSLFSKGFKTRTLSFLKNEFCEFNEILKFQRFKNLFSELKTMEGFTNKAS